MQFLLATYNRMYYENLETWKSLFVKKNFEKKKRRLKNFLLQRERERERERERKIGNYRSPINSSATFQRSRSSNSPSKNFALKRLVGHRDETFLSFSVIDAFKMSFARSFPTWRVNIAREILIIINQQMESVYVSRQSFANL